METNTTHGQAQNSHLQQRNFVGWAGIAVEHPCPHTL